MKQEWFKIALFLMTSLFWALFYKQESACFLLVAVFFSFLSLWLLTQKAKGE